MKIYHDINSVASQPRFVAIGTFDGVHVGHQKIIQQLVDEANQEGVESMVITFDPHPRAIVGLEAPELLTDIETRAEVIASFGVNELFVIRFDQDFSHLSAGDFVKRFLVDGLSAQKVFVGFNFRFGHGGTGDVSSLRSLGAALDFEVCACKPVTLDGGVVSSTNIRRLIREGDVSAAEKLIGRPYEVAGVVTHGEGRGRTIGFPTANVETPTSRVSPALGVYAVSCDYETDDGHWTGSWLGVANIGRQPTFADQGQARPVRLEVHLLDFDADLYGRRMRVRFLERIREEKKFFGVRQLVDQLKRDITQTVDRFGVNSIKKHL